MRFTEKITGFLSIAAAGLSVAASEIRFEKTVLAPEYFCDGIATGDINRDKILDIVAGPYWYAGPDFKIRKEIFPAQAFSPEQTPASDSMFSFVYDFNEDGWPDVLVLGRIKSHEAFWYENPGASDGPWKKHFAIHRVNGESKLFFDIDGDGRPELIAHHEGRWGAFSPDWENPTKPWGFRALTSPGDWKEYHHGTGVGDINGDGRLDLVLYDGWWEQPEKKDAQWIAHPMKFGAGRGGAQMLVFDVDGDGDSDVVSALDAHLWGMAWFEQVRSENGEISFVQHKIMGDRSEESIYGVAFSQAHALCLGDVNGDGLPDVIVGKRRWAHGLTGDVEATAAPVVYWFELQRGSEGARFLPRLVDDASGVGVQIEAIDLNGDGCDDILTASKLGTFLFKGKRFDAADSGANGNKR